MRKALSTLARRLSPSHSAGNAVVLMYHRIGPPGTADGGVMVSSTHFGQHLQALRDHFVTVPLAELVASLAAGAAPRRSVAITFDDGYVDNLTAAKPLLERHDVPATVFVVSGYVGSGRRFWWDELERICTSPATLPERLELATRGSSRAWDVDAGADRRPLFRELRELLGGLEEDEREDALAQLQVWANPAPGEGELETLSADQLRELHRSGLVDIGAHTVTHPRLTDLPSEHQLDEIRGSVRQLAEYIDRGVTLFSYPFGAHDETTVACAREAELACACTTESRGIDSTTDPYRLPRLYVGDWPADVLIARVSETLL